MTDNIHPDNQYIIHDAVHGAIELNLFKNVVENNSLIELINSSAVQRLRNIKQLGFAYLTFQSADHSRYSHAIGTMWMANKIFQKVLKHFKKNGTFKEIKIVFGVEEKDVLKYILVAALLQDVGELPFGQATNNLIRPDNNLRKNIADDILKTKLPLDDKQIFTLSIIYDNKTRVLINNVIGEKVKFGFLVYLLVGEFDKKYEKSYKCKGLRNILDGVVDADRLDYVFRDAHHTFGNSDNADLVISSLVRYDAETPVFNDPGAISDFFLKRWHLWNNVYFAPENRFNSILLKEYLRKTTDNRIGEIDDFHFISLPEFMMLDDYYLWNHLKSIGDSKKIKGIAKITLDNLLKHKKPYEWLWIEKNDVCPTTEFTIPEQIFYDTFSNYDGHKLYKRNSVIVSSPQYKSMVQPVYLENCSGTIGSLVSKNGWETLPDKNCILLFEPYETLEQPLPFGPNWDSYKKAFENKTLYQAILQKEIKDVTDTWDDDNFSEPKIFISYASEDEQMMIKIVQALVYLKKKYFFIKKNANDTYGSTVETNCLERIKNAGLILVIGSESYLRKTPDKNTGVAIEFDFMKKHKEKNIVKVIGIEEDYKKVNSHAWSTIIEGTNIVTNDLLSKSVSEIIDIVKATLDK